MKREPYFTASGKKARCHPDYMKEWWKRNPRKYLFASAKKRAERRKLAFNITEEDIIIPELCPILNLPLGEVHNSESKEFSPCLDRINNNRGYIKGNIAVISYRANRLKSNVTLEILERLIKYVSSAD